LYIFTIVFDGLYTEESPSHAENKRELQGSTFWDKQFVDEIIVAMQAPPWIGKGKSISKYVEELWKQFCDCIGQPCLEFDVQYTLSKFILAA